MKIYVICNLEGVAGIFDHRKQCWFDGKFFEQARRLATLELNALVEGALASGATVIRAWDAHGLFPGCIDIERLHPECELISGSSGIMPSGLDSTYDAVLLLGQHAMAGTSWAVLAHTFQPHFAAVWLNGTRVGQIGIACALAGGYWVPVVFVSGDRAAIEEARGLVPEIETAIVKVGLSRAPTGLVTMPARSLPPQKARELIRETAARAIGNIGQIRPYHVEAPFTYRVQFSEKRVADEKATLPGVTRVDATTVETETQDLFKLPF